MESMIWQDEQFASKTAEHFRKHAVSRSFYWLTLNLVPSLWLSAIVSPGVIWKSMQSNANLRVFLPQILLLSLLCLFVASCVFHCYNLFIALGGMNNIWPKASKPNKMASSTALFGPDVFSFSPRSSTGRLCYGAPESPWTGGRQSIDESAVLNCSSSSWFSSSKQPPSASFRQSPSEVSPTCGSPCSFSSPVMHTPGLFASSPIFGTSTTSMGQQSLDNCWPLALNRQTPPRPCWNTSSPSTAGGTGGNSGTSSILSLQYQVSPVPPGDRSLPSLANNYQSAAAEFGLRHSASDVRLSERDALEYWKANGVTSADLERWTINIRRWLHGTIVRRVLDEITSVNTKMMHTSEDAALIGSTTLNTLEQLAIGKYQHISSLPTLIRFLNCTKEQGYLVFRLQELARGSCLEEFRWDGGSRSTVSPWKDNLPTDTLILLHLFSTYMDARLPSHPKCLSGRSFSQLHVVRYPDRPDMKTKYTAQLYVSKIQPPVVRVVLDGNIYFFPMDRKNFYHALLMFFHFYHSLDGTIRSISLGSSGLNLSWVFQKH